MQNIEERIREAIYRKSSFSSDNTRVEYSPSEDASKVYLKGSLIATVVHGDALFGWGDLKVAMVEETTLARYPQCTTEPYLRALGLSCSRVVVAGKTK